MNSSPVAESSQRKLRILLCEGSSPSARQTLYGLGSNYEIDLLDPSRLCMCRFSRFVQHWHRCPAISRGPAEYLKLLAQTLQRGNYDVLFPTHEQAYVLAKYRETLTRHVGIALPEFQAIERVQNKVKFARLLEELDLPSPETAILGSLAEVAEISRFPSYLKLAHGTAGRGVHLLRDAEDLRRVVETLKRDGAGANGAEFIVQAPASGIHSVVQTVFQHGRLVAAHCLEAHALGVGGGQAVRVSASHPGVVEDVRRMGRHLNWHGPMFAEYFYDPATGQPQYIEINPRMGEPVNARLAGVNLCELVVRISLGEEVEPVGPTRPGVRSHVGAFMVLLAAAASGASRGALIREWFRVTRGKGIYGGCSNEVVRPGEDWLSVVPGAGTVVQLLANPNASHRIIRRAVENYSLPESAAELLHLLPDDAMETYFENLDAIGRG